MNRFIHTRLFILSWLLACSSYAHEHDLQAFIDSQRGALPAQFDFVQQRNIRGLPRPLISHGVINVHDHLIIWKTLYPIAQELLISADGIEDVSTDTQLRGSQIIATLLLAVLGGDADNLSEHFHYQLVDQCIVLTPHNEAIAQFVQLINSCGSPHLDTIELHEPSGNSTIIRLTAVGPVSVNE